MAPDQHDQPEGFTFDVPPAPRRTSSVGFLLDAARARPSGQRALSTLVVLLFLSGAGMFTYPIFTDLYTEQVLQSRAAEEFARIDFEVETYDEWERTVRGNTGAALTKIAIPRIGIETLVVEGTSPAALRAGAGHYPNTPLPGQAGNVAIAGHRTTYGKPFNRLDEVRVGDSIWLATPVGDHRYEVVAEPASPTCKPTGSGLGACITTPKDWQVISPTAEPTLTLTTCHPKGSAAKRLILRAVLVESHPAGTYDGLRDAGTLEASA
jgi:sortase A